MKHTILIFLLASSVGLRAQVDSCKSKWSFSIEPFIGNSCVYNDQLKDSKYTQDLKSYWYFSGQLAINRKLNDRFSLSVKLSNMIIGKKWIFDGTALFLTGNSSRNSISYIYKYHFINTSLNVEYALGKNKSTTVGLGIFTAFNYANFIETDQYGDYKTTEYDNKSVLFKNLYGLSPYVKYRFYKRSHIDLGICTEFDYSLNTLYDKRNGLNSRGTPYNFNIGLYLQYHLGYH
jgi:hypothetical protein